MELEKLELEELFVSEAEKHALHGFDLVVGRFHFAA